ncbi:hypothetical protein HGRIS_005748 [Hohenbuehelia grisea]|uniref:Uncharacterized protein n=1 Tax=Hohenbuehelia grisea TaxID=104357 RepID=A0ABR3JXR2_9AGAR
MLYILWSINLFSDLQGLPRLSGTQLDIQTISSTYTAVHTCHAHKIARDLHRLGRKRTQVLDAPKRKATQVVDAPERKSTQLLTQVNATSRKSTQLTQVDAASRNPFRASLLPRGLSMRSPHSTRIFTLCLEVLFAFPLVRSILEFPDGSRFESFNLALLL